MIDLKKYLFSAYNLTSEFDLNKIAQHFNISRKFKWEDSLYLDHKQLKTIISDAKLKYAKIYSFGSIIFINFSDRDIIDLIEYFSSNLNIKIHFSRKYEDEYELRISDASNLETSNNFAQCDEMRFSEAIEIISLILARSVALDRMETSIVELIDEVEDIINFLEKGKLNIKDNQLAKLVSRILSFKYSSVSNIMLFDKPDITWEDIDIDDFYYQLVELFELKERYEQIKHKSELLMDITEVFSTLSHEKRSTRLEWMIIILIVIEIILAVVMK